MRLKLLVGLFVVRAAPVKAQAPRKGGGPAESKGSTQSCREWLFSDNHCKRGEEVLWNGPQGQYLEGPGLERLHFVWVGATGSPAGQFPLVAGMTLKAVELEGCANSPAKPRKLELTIVSCIQSTGGRAQCAVKVTKGAGICKERKLAGVSIVSGYWDGKGGYRADEGTFTLSCDVSADEYHGEMRFDGALTRCIERYRYLPDTRRDELLACIRMLRADYCGNGDPHTRDGTAVDAYDQRGVNPSACIPGTCFESSWSAVGAEAIAHTRYAEPDGGIPQCDGDFWPEDGGIRWRKGSGPKPTVLVRTAMRAHSPCETTPCTFDVDPAVCDGGTKGGR